MAGFTDTVEQDILNGVFAAAAWAGYASLWVALSSTAPTDAGANVTEPTTGAYARVQTVNADWAAATGTAPTTKSNANVITFPTATADWLAGVNLTHFVLFDATTLGDAVATGALDVAKPVLNGDTASFAVGQLSLKLGDEGDPF